LQEMNSVILQLFSKWNRKKNDETKPVHEHFDCNADCSWSEGSMSSLESQLSFGNGNEPIRIMVSFKIIVNNC
jgi:hypothetical protein